MPEETTPFVVICAVCHKPALRLVCRPAPNAPLRSADFRHLDGRQVMAGEKQQCDSCGKPLRRRPEWDSLKTSNIREAAHV